MPKANQRALFERGVNKTDAPSKRTQAKGIKNKFSGKGHNHFPQGKTGYDPKISRLNTCQDKK